jgi:ABC-2 type transport system permease protein
MYSYFKSEALKIKHTFVVKVAFIAPIFAILFALLLMPAYFEVNSYNWWYVSIFPGMISLGCALVAVKDKKMKNMAVLSLPIDLKKVWMSKIFVCTVMIAFASLIHLVGNIIIGNVFGIGQWGKAGILNVMLASLILIITFLWQIPLCLFLTSKIGMFPTILINIGAYAILGIVLAVNKVLWIIPYAIPSRLMCPILKVLPNGLPAVPGVETFTPELLSGSVILPGIIITVGLFVILTFVTARWYEGQEAK